jgi:hypothetical protein
MKGKWVEHPGVYDVLFRRGGKHNNHFGNVEFQQIMFSKLTAYNSTNNHFEKRRLRDDVIRLVKESNNNGSNASIVGGGGRFLEYDKECGCWTEITNVTEIHNKIIPAINDLNRTVAAKRNQQKSKCCTGNKFLGQDGPSYHADTTGETCSTKRRKLDS